MHGRYQHLTGPCLCCKRSSIVIMKERRAAAMIGECVPPKEVKASQRSSQGDALASVGTAASFSPSSSVASFNTSKNKRCCHTSPYLSSRSWSRLLLPRCASVNPCAARLGADVCHRQTQTPLAALRFTYPDVPYMVCTVRFLGVRHLLTPARRSTPTTAPAESRRACVALSLVSGVAC